jgi:hypothetical protein
MGARNIEVACVGEFAYNGSYPLSEDGPIVGHIFTDVQKLTPAGMALLKYAAGKVKGIVQATGPYGKDRYEIRVLFAENITSEATRKAKCLMLIEQFGTACQHHMEALNSDPITCERLFTEETVLEMDRMITRPPVGSPN